MIDKATPRPWTYDAHGGTFYVWATSQAMVADGHDDEPGITRMRGVGRGASVEEQQANAELICRAVNAHDVLVAALASAVEQLEALRSIYQYTDGDDEATACVVARAEAVLGGFR